MLNVLAVSLLLTLLLEEGFALVWGLRGKRELGLTALVNCLTNPPVVLLYHTATGLWRWNAVPVTIVLETAAVIVEWLCYRTFSEQVKRPFLFALLINLFSYGVGCVINFLWIWRF
ncbi:MAG: hypothetical protein K2N78_11830 [Oscillospiraceae bacterium]|nr:hypothetical protein [Oscillospiraceae bacterium]